MEFCFLLRNLNLISSVFCSYIGAGEQYLKHHSFVDLEFGLQDVKISLMFESVICPAAAHFDESIFYVGWQRLNVCDIS